MTVISDEYAAELVAKMRAAHESRDELTADPIDPRDLLILKMWDDLKALEKAMSFLGGGIKPVRSVG
jgi:hypothetical protein